MIYLYDNAILDKIRKWTLDKKITITGPNDTTQLFTYIADVNQDEIQLPLFALSRTGDIDLLQTQKKVATYKGMPLNVNKDKGESLRFIPIELNYQFDIYTRTRQECDNYLREFIFGFLNKPKLTIQIPYNQQNKTTKRQLSCNLRLRSNVPDNSNIPEHRIRGQYYRHTINLYIDDAYLVDTKVRDTLKIDWSLGETQDEGN